MTRTVRDAALLLDAMRVPGRAVMGRRVPNSYADDLDDIEPRRVRLAWGLRYAEGYFGPGDDDQAAVMSEALGALRRTGVRVHDVTSIDPLAPGPDGITVPFDAEFVALLFEFKAQIEQYLATLGDTSMRTLGDLMQFNLDRCEEEMPWYGQEIFEMAESTGGDLSSPDYLAARSTTRWFGQTSIGQVLASGFDAVIMPTYSFGTSPAACAGYPSIAVPVGYTSYGRPVGFWLAAAPFQEAKLLRIARHIERSVGGRVAPTYGGTAIEPQPAGLCGDITPTSTAKASAASRPTPRNW
jgi:amidase